MTLAHGAGAGMNHPFMVTLSDLLAEAGIASLRFNFPFIEHNKRRPDFPAVAHKTVEAAILHARETFPLLPLFVAGKSFGGRMSSQYLSAVAHPMVKGIIFYGFPLHTPDKVSAERADHLKHIQIPMLFLQGTRDAMARISLLEPVCASLPHASLKKIEGADHGFKAGKLNTLPLLATATREWIDAIIK